MPNRATVEIIMREGVEYVVLRKAGVSGIKELPRTEYNRIVDAGIDSLLYETMVMNRLMRELFEITQEPCERTD